MRPFSPSRNTSKPKRPLADFFLARYIEKDREDMQQLSQAMDVLHNEMEAFAAMMNLPQPVFHGQDNNPTRIEEGSEDDSETEVLVPTEDTNAVAKTSHAKRNSDFQSSFNHTHPVHSPLPSRRGVGNTSSSSSGQHHGKGRKEVQPGMMCCGDVRETGL
ncbi:hypothetical protein F5I97DRAFT_1886568 [Phlebopus sp. FC_14]|nr:hypothetical protein F5I97DRAFT_1886568 [Phlebopus sp. FC_14]